ncbi:MAG: ammonium transporter [Spirochaetia bacterium]|nr:ammonium transporter [Spirochaetia bacterium]
MKKSSLFTLAVIILSTTFPSGVVFAQDIKAAVSAEDVMAYSFDNIILFISAILVLFMQAGFAMVEAGLNSSKNAVNILFKNLMDVSFGVLFFWLLGFGLMYPGSDFEGMWFGFGGFGAGTEAPNIAAGALHPQGDFLFQAAFAATAATIVSGAVAGRMKFHAYLIYSIILTAFIYPISGMWKWGGGWLNALGFHDFAGSLVVHAVGGFAGLAGAIILGPRIGKFNPAGKPQIMPAHSLTLASLGVFILWIGWYGFNPGSQLAFAGSDNVSAVLIIAVNTTLAAAAGAAGAMSLTWVMYKKPELSMALNGALAGLVGITANCDAVSNVSAILIGLIAGFIVVFGIKFLDKLKIDDPVGAFPVHGLSGVWGGIAAGIFGGKDLTAQIIGSIAIPVWAFISMFAVFYIIDKIIGLRVTREEELKGLDITEHGEEAYSGFQVFTLE